MCRPGSSNKHDLPVDPEDVLFRLARLYVSIRSKCDLGQAAFDLLMQAGPVAASTAKALVRRIANTHDAHTIDAQNAALIAGLRVSPEGQEGLSAFLGKRKPAWTET